MVTLTEEAHRIEEDAAVIKNTRIWTLIVVVDLEMLTNAIPLVYNLDSQKYATRC